MCDYRVCVESGARLWAQRGPDRDTDARGLRADARLRVGRPGAARASLFGEIFTPQQALALGMVNELAPANEVLDRAIAVRRLHARGLP